MTTQAPERERQGREQQDDASVFLDGVLIDRRISFWRGRRPLTAKDLGLNDQDVPEIYSLGSKLIIPREALRRFEQVEQQAQYVTDQFTFPFPTGRARFVPYTVLPEVLDTLRKLQESFYDRLDTFLQKYDQYRQEIIERYPQAAEALKQGYENADTLRKKYHFEWMLYEVRLPRNLRYQAIEERDARADAAARRQALESAEAEYRAQYEKQIDEFLGGAVGSLRAAVGNAAVSISEKIANGEAVTKPAIESLKKTIERFRTLNFVGDDQVEAKLAELEQLIPTETGKKLQENAEVRDAFASALNEVTSTLMESDVSGVTGEYKRRLRW